MPAIIPIIVTPIPDTFAASGTSSKHTIDIISPAANDNMKLNNLFDGFFKFTPIIPPIVVPNVPKNKPSNDVFNISLNFIFQI